LTATPAEKAATDSNNGGGDGTDAPPVGQYVDMMSSDGALGPAFTVTSHIQGEAVVLSAAGEIDLLTAGKLDQAIAAVLAGTPPPPVLVVDLTDVTFLDSAGLGVLTHNHMAASPLLAFRVVASNPFTLKPIRLTGLDRLLALFDTVDEALAA
jgi:anti-anti-sigma factor